jgi:Fe-S cluster assembly iron-binding protein IscA
VIPTSVRPTGTGDPRVRSPNPEPEPAPAQIPDWADSYYLDRFRAVGRHQPENRRVITVTPAAAAYIRSAAAETGVRYVRVRIEVFRDAGGTPTGFRNRVDLVMDVYPEFDFIDDAQSVPVVIDRRSAAFVDGATLDWVEGADGRSGLDLRPPAR